MKRVLLVCALFTLMSCTTGSVVDSTANNPAPDVGQPAETQPEEAVSQMHAADGAIPLGKMAVIAATNWTDPVGSLASLDTSASYAATTARITTDGSDVVLRSFGGRIYVLNRFGTDTIQVVDPTSYSVVADYSVGGGSNPQDIWVLSDEKAYVTRHDSQNDKEIADDLLIINPLTGAQIGSLDFKSYMEDDGDKLSRAAQMVVVDKKLFVCLQDLQSNLMDPANTSGKIAVIDTDTDEIIKVIELAGRNPADITYSIIL